MNLKKMLNKRFNLWRVIKEVIKIYPDKFFSFKNGKPISNSTVNTLLEEIKQSLITEKDGEHCFIGSGDTFVAGFKLETEYLFIVSNRDGYSELIVDRQSEDINEIRFE